RSVLFHAHTHGKQLTCRSVLLQRRHIRGRWWRRCSQYIFQNPFAASYGRSPIRVRRYHQDAGLAQEPTAILVCERYALEIIPMDVGDTIKPRQPFIQEGIVGGQQIHHAAVFLYDASKEEFSFSYEVMP